jgi:hypothetical protein
MVFVERDLPHLILAVSPNRPPGGRSRFLRGAAAERVAKEGPASAWVELEPICSEQQLDQVLAEAQQLDLPIVLLW